MYYTIYETTNNINGKIYRGMHQTSNLDDGYLGSGTLLLQAIKKYGKENFSKEILYILDTETEMIILESQLVDFEFVMRNDTYNLKTGGMGGTAMSPDTRLKMSRSHTGKVVSDNTRIRIREGLANTPMTHERRQAIIKAHTGKTVSDNTREKMSKAQKGKLVSNETREKLRNANLGKTASDTTKAKMSKSAKQNVGEKHSKFNGYYITPLGRYTSALAASEANRCSPNTIIKRCNNSSYVAKQQNPNNMSWRERGFWFDPKP